MAESKKIEEVLQRLSQWEKRFDFETPVEMNQDIHTYLNYYGLNITNVSFHFGKVETNGTNTIVQMFAPKESKGTVFLLHGYLDHVGHLKHIIQFLNKHGYTVISYDLEGHGLSAGKAAAVQHFSDYVDSLEKLMEMANRNMNGPFYVIGHSTGGAIAINYVLKHQNHVFDKVILAAPLVRSSYWYGTIIGYYMAKIIPFIQQVKRKYRVNSSNQYYLDLRKIDPLQTDAIPIEWIGALLRWNKTIHKLPPAKTKTYVIQGNCDDTVQWKYNLKFLEKKFPCLKMVQIDNGQHALFNEAAAIRELTFSFIIQFLQEK
ncbi:alpha/beta hydrolase [Halobacillus sp. MO56]